MVASTVTENAPFGGNADDDVDVVRNTNVNDSIDALLKETENKPEVLNKAKTKVSTIQSQDSSEDDFISDEDEGPGTIFTVYDIIIYKLYTF